MAHLRFLRYQLYGASEQCDSLATLKPRRSPVALALCHLAKLGVHSSQSIKPGLERDASFVPSRGLSKVSLSFCPAAVGSDEKLGNILNPSKSLLARHWTMQWPVFGADCCKTFKRYMYDTSLRVVEILRKWSQTQVSLLEGKWQRVARARKININRAEEVPSVAKPVFCVKSHSLSRKLCAWPQGALGKYHLLQALSHLKPRSTLVLV